MTDWANILNEDLSWREAELASLKRIAITNSDNKVAFASTLRASWALLYAHYEGFTKFCWDLLVDCVQEQKIPIEKLSNGFKILALEKSFRELRSDTSSASLWNYYAAVLPGTMKFDANFPEDCRLATESNLWPGVFERECAKIGITSNELAEFRLRIEALVARRNEIAHGKKMTIKTIDEYSEYEHAAFMVLYDLAIQTLDILQNSSFRQVV